MAIAAIEGNTAFIEATPQQLPLQVFSREGQVRSTSASGQQVVPQSGEDLLC